MSDWSTEEIDQLWEVYPEKSWPDIIAALLPRTKSAIRNKVRELGIRRVIDVRPAWQAREVQFLIENYEKLSKGALCAKITRHSWSAIQKKATSLKTTRDRARKKTLIGLVATLRAERRLQRKTLEWLSRRIRVHPVLLCNYERGMAAPPRIDILDRWAAALGLEIRLHRVPR